MCFALNSRDISRVFQPEFTGLFFDVLGNGKTWIVILIGPILALIPDFLYNCVQVIYFPTPSQSIIKPPNNGSRIMASEDEQDVSIIDKSRRLVN
jgi:hypothetical protein